MTVLEGRVWRWGVGVGGGIVMIVMLNVQIWRRTHHLQRCAAASPLGLKSRDGGHRRGMVLGDRMWG